MKLIRLPSIKNYILSRIEMEFRIKNVADERIRLHIFNHSKGLGKLLNALIYVFRKSMKIKELKGALTKMSPNQEPVRAYFNHVCSAFGILPKLTTPFDVSIPEKGPVIFYANHPFSGMDVFGIASVIEKFRPDLKVLAASYLAKFPGFKNNGFIIDTVNKDKWKERNKMVYEAINTHVQSGKALLIFPAGLVSCWSKTNKIFAMDPPWKHGLISFAAQVPETRFIPIFIEGEPSPGFLKMHLKARLLSNFLIIREFANQINTKMNFSFGKSIVFSELEELNMADKISYLRAHLYALGTKYFYKAKGLQMAISPEYCHKSPLLTKWESSLLNK